MLKRTAAVMATACGMICLFSTTCFAQVCVVDVAKVFDNHAQFNSQLDILKQQAEEYKFSLQQRGEKLRAESEQLKNFEVGSTDYKALETKLAEASALMEVERRNKTREFVQAEAQLHFDTYVQVTQLISDYCEQRGFRVAMRFNALQMDPNAPQSIMQRVNEFVVFYNPQIDITQQIIGALGGAAAQVGQAPQSQNR